MRGGSLAEEWRQLHAISLMLAQEVICEASVEHNREAAQPSFKTSAAKLEKEPVHVCLATETKLRMQPFDDFDLILVEQQTLQERTSIQAFNFCDSLTWGHTDAVPSALGLWGGSNKA